MANGWGGKRPGAGRKKLAVKYQGPIQSAQARWIEALPELTEIWLAKARQGDKDVLKDILNRIMGRPTESVELSGVDGEPLRITYVVGKHDDPNG